MPIDTAAKRAAFRDLHREGCFIIPNPWDIGSIRRLEARGFKALASTSSGLAWSLGRQDGDIGCDTVLDHLRFLCAATNLPVNADFEAGYADDAAGVAVNVALAIGTGVAGLSIEDSDGTRLFDRREAMDRLRAARGAIDRSGQDVMLIGRSEGFLVGRPDLNETIDRLRAYADAGADCLYAPGIQDLDALARIVEAVAPRPVNVLIGGPGLRVADVEKIGARRVSVGGSLAAAAWKGFNAALDQLMTEGTLPSRT